LCPGSFDPVTLGHLDIFARAARLFDEVLVAVGENTTKNYLLGFDERLRLVEQAVAGLPNVRAVRLEGLLVAFARANGASAIVKGLRFGSDFDYELQQAHLNSAVGGVETVLLPSGREFGTISSTMLREVALNGGDISAFVTPEANLAVLEAVARRNGGACHRHARAAAPGWRAPPHGGLRAGPCRAGAGGRRGARGVRDTSRPGAGIRGRGRAGARHRRGPRRGPVRAVPE
jgi:pantetheine-phosphate adenylyltransferase